MAYLFKNMISIFLMVLVNQAVQASAVAHTNGFAALWQKAEHDVLELRAQVEKAYKHRCDVATMERCQHANYDGCVSSFPNPVCLDEHPSTTGGGGGLVDWYQHDGVSSSYNDGNDDSCSGSVWDHTVSSILIPSSLANQTTHNQNLMESICFSQALDEYFVEKALADRNYWAEEWSMDKPVSVYFGDASGAFRIFPARPQEFCGERRSDGIGVGVVVDENGYDNDTSDLVGTPPLVGESHDPRERPWYLTATTGLKNVIMILDASGSMRGSRLDAMKKAAAGVIDTLTSGDRIAVVPFSTAAYEVRIDSNALVNASSRNKVLLKAHINELEAVGSTNIYAALERAFDIVEDGISQDLVVKCTTAFIFLTDGKMTNTMGFTEDQVVNYAQGRLQELEEMLDNPVYVFSYSISESNSVHTFPQQLACASRRGVWSRILNDTSMVESLAGYHKLLTFGLSHGTNENFTAWVEPYHFSTSRVLGITVSAPAFDRSVDPPLLIGVVGLDLPMSILEGHSGGNETLNHVVLPSTAQCPVLNTTACQLEAFRASGVAGEEALCNVSCDEERQEYSGLPFEHQKCLNNYDLPLDFVANRNHESTTFMERACCNLNGDTVGGNIPDESDDSTANNTSEKDRDSSVITHSHPDGPEEEPKSILLAIILPLCAIVLIALALLISRQRAKDEDEEGDENDEADKAESGETGVEG